ncbi:MAG: hypothetical protein ACRDPM_22270 [Solirubrobacteraceae bacterium]
MRNLHAEDAHMRNVHDPALGFPHYMWTLHDLVANGKVRSLPPKDPRSMIHLAMRLEGGAATLGWRRDRDRDGHPAGLRPGSRAHALQTGAAEVEHPRL